MTTRRTSLVLAGAAVVFAVFCAPVAHADTGWVVAASSPSHKQMDFGYGPTQAAAESPALAQCAQLQRADDCLLLASGPDCVAVAWDVGDVRLKVQDMLDDRGLGILNGFKGC